MKTEVEKWYRCKKDIILTLMGLTAFGISGINYNALYILDDKEWIKNLSWIWGIFFRWGIWMVTMPLTIQSMYICLDHYWKWIGTSAFGLLVLNVIATVVSTPEGVGWGTRIIDSANQTGFILTAIDVIREYIPMMCSLAFLDAIFVAPILIGVFIIRKLKGK